MFFLALLASLLTIIAILAFSPLAIKIGLVDRPGGRKKHTGDIPFIGGISIFFVLNGFAFFTGLLSVNWTHILIAASILIFVGFLDDLLDIRASYKLIIQIMATLFVVLINGEYIKSIGQLTDGTDFLTGEFGYFITFIAVVGLINAFNMMDGIDGLAATQAILAITFIFISLYLLFDTFKVDIFIILFFGSLIGFLTVNLGFFPGNKVFLGDSGSMLIGFCVAWLLINKTQLPDNHLLPPSIALWSVAIPVVDTLTLSVRRILKRKSPFNSDREHLHHIVMRLGLNPNQSLIFICLLSTFMFFIGVTIFNLFGDLINIILFILFNFAYYFTISSLLKDMKKFKK